jgi:hypothetical protein
MVLRPDPSPTLERVGHPPHTRQDLLRIRSVIDRCRRHVGECSGSGDSRASPEQAVPHPWKGWGTRAETADEKCQVEPWDAAFPVIYVLWRILYNASRIARLETTMSKSPCHNDRSRFRTPLIVCFSLMTLSCTHPHSMQIKRPCEHRSRLPTVTRIRRTRPPPRCSELTFHELERMAIIHCASIMQVTDTMCYQSEAEVLGAVGRVSQVDTSFAPPARTEVRRYSILGVEVVGPLAEGLPPDIFPGPTDVELAEIYSLGRGSFSRMSRLKGRDLEVSLAVYLSPRGPRSEWVIHLLMSSRVVGPEPGRIEVRCDSAERLRGAELKLTRSEEQTG